MADVQELCVKTDPGSKKKVLVIHNTILIVLRILSVSSRMSWEKEDYVPDLNLEELEARAIAARDATEEAAALAAEQARLRSENTSARALEALEAAVRNLRIRPSNLRPNNSAGASAAPAEPPENVENVENMVEENLNPTDAPLISRLQELYYITTIKKPRNEEHARNIRGKVTRLNKVQSNITKWQSGFGPLTPSKRSRVYPAPNNLAKERSRLFNELKGYYDSVITDQNSDDSYNFARKKLVEIKAKVGAAGAAAEIQRILFAKLDELAPQDAEEEEKKKQIIAAKLRESERRKAQAEAEVIGAMRNGGRRIYKSRKNRRQRLKKTSKRFK